MREFLRPSGAELFARDPKELLECPDCALAWEVASDAIVWDLGVSMSSVKRCVCHSLKQAQMRCLARALGVRSVSHTPALSYELSSIPELPGMDEV